MYGVEHLFFDSHDQQPRLLANQHGNENSLLNGYDICSSGYDEHTISSYDDQSSDSESSSYDGYTSDQENSDCTGKE